MTAPGSRFREDDRTPFDDNRADRVLPYFTDAVATLRDALPGLRAECGDDADYLAARLSDEASDALGQAAIDAGNDLSTLWNTVEVEPREIGTTAEVIASAVTGEMEIAA